MKTKIIGTVFISLLVGAIVGAKCMQTDLEIYTNDNIYFIDGLTVENEANTTILHFSSKAELKEYIGTITANESNEVESQFIWNDDRESIPTDGSKIVLEFTRDNKIYLGTVEANE